MWRDEAWLLDMLQACRKALQHAEGLTEQGFHASALYQDAIIRQLTVLGEAAKQISPEFRDAHPEVPWKKIAGFRDVVVHAYFRLDLDQVWRIVQHDLPGLTVTLERLVPPEEASR
jgi:uncharacterized protein with HEPN domain